VRVLCRGWLASRSRSPRRRALRVAMGRAAGPCTAAGGGRPRPLCLGAVGVDIVRELFPPTVLPSPLSAWARWHVGRSGSAPVVSVPTSAPLWLGRWLRTHVILFHRPLVRASATPSLAEGTIFLARSVLPLLPHPPGRWDRGEQSGREGPPPPFQPCPGVRRLMALPTHRAPILELFGVRPLRPSSAVTVAVV
jgi:hypothetical protein